jgi:hypothetical protein
VRTVGDDARRDELAQADRARHTRGVGGSLPRSRRVAGSLAHVGRGENARHIATLVPRRALTVVGAGLVAGIVIAVAATSLLRSMLYGIGAHDPLSFAGTAVLLVLVALAACAPPIRRALRVDPMEALRSP